MPKISISQKTAAAVSKENGPKPAGKHLPGSLGPLQYKTKALSGRKSTRFRFVADAGARAAIARTLNLLDLASLELIGEIIPIGRGDFRLEAQIVARAVQPCSVTLVPVPAQVNEAVLRLYLAEYTYPESDESELLDDDTTEPLPEVIDLADLAVEALALALPLYPRAEGVGSGSQVFGPPGVEPLTDDALKPFAGLAGLAQALGKDPK